VALCNPILYAKGLGVTLKHAPILADIDLSLSPGDMLAVAGPNGAGKTTLLRCLAGILPPSSGTVLLDGAPLTALSRRETARRVAYCPQDTAGRLGFTASQAVLMGRLPFLDRFATASPADRDSARAAMEALDILHLAKRKVTELSGGEKQRVALARTLIQVRGDDPVCRRSALQAQGGGAARREAAPGCVYLLDEPTAGLDIRHALLALRVYSSKAREQGAAVVAVLHDLNLAAMFCPHMLLLDNGRVAAYGPTPQVLTEDNLSRVFRVRAAVDGLAVRFLEDA